MFLVADGMGGHSRGEVASRAVVDAFRPLSSGEWVNASDLAMAVSRAQRAVEGLRDGGHAEPGSTLAGVALSEQGGRPCWLVFNIGDSRTYRLRAGELEQVSVDHSQVQALIDEAGYSAAKARRSAPRNVITRAIGAGLLEPQAADEWLLIAAPGDRLLICTDGLTTELTDHLIAATLLSAPEPAAAAQALVDAAVTAGGRDNVTVIVVDAVVVDSPAAVPGDDVDTVSTSPDGVGAASRGPGDGGPEIDTLPSLIGAPLAAMEATAADPTVTQPLAAARPTESMAASATATESMAAAPMATESKATEPIGTAGPGGRRSRWWPRRGRRSQ